MDKNKNELEEYFGNSFTKDFLELFDDTLRYSVTSISAGCVQLLDNENIKDDPKSKYAVDHIVKMCCVILQSTQITRLLSDCMDGRKMKLATVSAERFITRFIESCMRLVGGKCRIIKGETADVFFVAQPDLLEYLMLCYVRRAVKRGAKELTISTAVSEDKAEIFIIAKDCDIYSVINSLPDISEKFFDSINEVFSEKFGGVCVPLEDGVKIRLPLEKAGTEFTVNKPLPDESGNLFSRYNVMLGDIADRVT